MALVAQWSLGRCPGQAGRSGNGAAHAPPRSMAPINPKAAWLPLAHAESSVTVCCRLSWCLRGDEVDKLSADLPWRRRPLGFTGRRDFHLLAKLGGTSVGSLQGKAVAEGDRIEHLHV